MTRSNTSGKERKACPELEKKRGVAAASTALGVSGLLAATCGGKTGETRVQEGAHEPSLDDGTRRRRIAVSSPRIMADLREVEGLLETAAAETRGGNGSRVLRGSPRRA